jgi:hypothetical protein
VSCRRSRSVSVQVLDKEMVDRTRAGSPFAPVLRASEIALDWRDGCGSRLVDVHNLDALLGTFLESLDSECEQVLRTRPLDVAAKALFGCLFEGVTVVQATLCSAWPLVQLCVVYGKSILGSNVQNVSSCLVAEVRRVERIICELGALLRWKGLSCEFSRSRASLFAPEG